MTARPIIIVTGANSGVGFGTCQRLLLQLADGAPDDALPRFSPLSELKAETEKTPYEGLTLIMACRSAKRAEAARKDLLALLDAHIRKLKSKPEYDGYADKFQTNLQVRIHLLDLASIESVFKFGNEMTERYPYISHLILNAGVATFTGINWPLAIYLVITDFMGAVSQPSYYNQTYGEMSADGLGWLWQCNVFGHYSLFRVLQPLLLACEFPQGPRVLWTSSMEASPRHHTPDDPQLIHNQHPYEASKYQIDLIATEMEQRAQASSTPIRHIIVQPGFASTNISNALIGWVLDLVKLAAFFLARWLGSVHHAIKPVNAGISGVYATLAPADAIPSDLPCGAPIDSMQAKLDGPWNKTPSGSVPGRRPARLGAETNRSGKPRVGLTEVIGWDAHASDAAKLVDHCEALYQKFWEEEGVSPAEVGPVDVEGY